jgi:glutathione synthase/RimK-type ligase-like ATP-grasp enzyme
MKPIAICKNDNIFKHSTQWIGEWIEYCEKNNIPYEIVNCYHYDIISQLPKYSALLWNFSNFVISDLLEARNILNIAAQKGLITFPDYNTSWHFDDKIAESYALQAVEASAPKSWVFYDLKECDNWLKNHAKYPIIAKLRCGSGANNVKMLKNYNQAKAYAKRMFTSGFNPTPSLIYKAYSKAQSSKNLATVLKRIKKIPEFLNTRAHAKQMPIEKGYCYFQEFVSNEGFDLKVAVVGDKLSFLCRDVRKGDFRASGGGDIRYTKELVTKQIIDSAFDAYDNLGMECVGFDYVVDKDTLEGKIIEMCYGFDHKAVMGAGGYWDRDCVWHDQPLNVPNEVIKQVISKIGNGDR